ncbi:unnamed protein product, partial [Ectocarpus sp. 12 AP-2014]
RTIAGSARRRIAPPTRSGDLASETCTFGDRCDAFAGAGSAATGKEKKKKRQGVKQASRARQRVKPRPNEAHGEGCASVATWQTTIGIPFRRPWRRISWRKN